MAIKKTDAIILKTRPFRSSSLIVHFFTENFGKVQGIAKGIHREGERRGADFELFNHVEILFYEKKSDLHLISEVSLIDDFSEIRLKLQNILYASYFAEIVDQSMEIHDPHPQVFELLKVVFRYLNFLSPLALSVLFEFKMIQELGWVPYLDGCLSCGKSPIERGNFSFREGQILCDACRMKDQTSIPLNPDELQLMRFMSSKPLDQCIKNQSSEVILKKLKEVFAQFLTYRLDRPLKTSKAISTLLPTSS